MRLRFVFRKVHLNNGVSSLVLIWRFWKYSLFNETRFKSVLGTDANLKILIQEK